MQPRGRVRRLIMPGPTKTSFQLGRHRHQPGSSMPPPANTAQCIRGDPAIDAKRRNRQRADARLGLDSPWAWAGTYSATAGARTQAWTPCSGPPRWHGAAQGEILLTSMDADSTKAGLTLPSPHAVSDAMDVPVIASAGGAWGDLDTTGRRHQIGSTRMRCWRRFSTTANTRWSRWRHMQGRGFQCGL